MILTEDLDKGTGKESKNSEDSKKEKVKSEPKVDKSMESGESTISEVVSSFKKFAMADELDETSSSKSDKKSDPKKNSKNEGNHSSLGEIFGHKTIESIKSKKDKIIKYCALLIGIFLIIYGLFLISGSVTRVADNVIFGEKAMLSTFLILLGFLIIVAAYAKTILNKTFLNKIHDQLEVAEGRNKSDKDSKKVDVNDNKIGKK